MPPHDTRWHPILLYAMSGKSPNSNFKLHERAWCKKVYLRRSCCISSAARRIHLSFLYIPLSDRKKKHLCVCVRDQEQRCLHLSRADALLRMSLRALLQAPLEPQINVSSVFSSLEVQIISPSTSIQSIKLPTMDCL